MAEEITKTRRLRGHKGTVTCCIASRNRPGVVATSGEDGCICWFDMRCKDVLFTVDLGKKPISSICFRPGDEDVVYASSGTEVMCLDVHLNHEWAFHMELVGKRHTCGLDGWDVTDLQLLSFPYWLPASSWKPLESYNHNKDEINQIACSPKSSFLAAADDSGDIKIMDIRQKCLYKTLRAGHTSICSSVQFLPWRPWEVITGGLDAKLVMWDFSKGRSCKILDFGLPNMDSCGNEGQCFNPAFVHAIAVPEMDMLEKSDKICVVARGDGVVDVIDIESELASVKSKSSLQHPKKSQSRSKDSTSTANTATLDQNRGNRFHLDYTLGGHTAAVSCVAFSSFGERGKFIISGGNDALVKVWDWSKHLDREQNCSNRDLLNLNITLHKKVNWLCTTPTDSENLVVCDTSKAVKVYSIS